MPRSSSCFALLCGKLDLLYKALLCYSKRITAVLHAKHRIRRRRSESKWRSDLFGLILISRLENGCGRRAGFIS